jgi:hypothetical protein
LVKESESNAIDLPEDDPAHIEYLLKYLYTLDIGVAGQGLTTIKLPTQKPRQQAIEVYSDFDAFALFALADRLELVEMKRHWHVALLTKAQNLDVEIKIASGVIMPSDEEKRRLQEKEQSLISFFNHAYDCENPGIDKVRMAAVELLERMPVQYRGSTSQDSFGRSQLMNILGDSIINKPQLGIDIIRALARSRNNQPVLELLKYQSVLDVLVADSQVIVQLVNSLVLSRS